MTGGNGTAGAYQALTAPGAALSSTGMTVGAGATLLVATLELGGNTTSPSALACTWNGVAMNLACSIYYASGIGTGSAIFTLVNPASGNKTLAATWTGNEQAFLSSISFTGTDTSTGYKSADKVTGNSVTSNPSIAVNTESTGATLVVIQSLASGLVPPSNQTQVYSGGPGMNNDSSASYALGGTGTNTHNFTALSAAVSWAGIHIIAPTVVTSSGLLIGASQGGF